MCVWCLIVYQTCHSWLGRKTAVWCKMLTGQDSVLQLLMSDMMLCVAWCSHFLIHQYGDVFLQVFILELGHLHTQVSLIKLNIFVQWWYSCYNLISTWHSQQFFSNTSLYKCQLGFGLHAAIAIAVPAIGSATLLCRCACHEAFCVCQVYRAHAVHMCCGTKGTHVIIFHLDCGLPLHRLRKLGPFGPQICLF